MEKFWRREVEKMGKCLRKRAEVKEGMNEGCLGKGRRRGSMDGLSERRWGEGRTVSGTGMRRRMNFEPEKEKEERE